MRKNRDIKLFIIDRRRKYLMSEPNYHTTKFFAKKIISNRNLKKKIEILRNIPVHLGLSVLELSKILVHEFWCNFVKPKYGKKLKLYYMDTDSFIVYKKTADSYKDIVEGIETRFDTSNYELNRVFLKVKNEKAIRLMKDELSRKNMTELVGIEEKTYSYLIDDSSEYKKVKDTKRCVKFENYKNCFE